MEKYSPLRLLVKNYENGLLERDQYLKVRQQLLKKLSTIGEITQEDLKNYLEIYQGSVQQNSLKSYSISDWIIIVLGLLAAATLGIFLYN